VTHVAGGLIAFWTFVFVSPLFQTFQADRMFGFFGFVVEMLLQFLIIRHLNCVRPLALHTSLLICHLRKRLFIAAVMGMIRCFFVHNRSPVRMGSRRVWTFQKI
jgi:hypothetical protein